MKTLQLDVETLSIISAQLSDVDRDVLSYDGENLSGPDASIDRVSALDLAALKKADLIAYANQRQWKIATGGYAFTINGAQIGFATDPTSLGLITGKAARLQQPNPPATIDWQTGPATFVTINAADFLTAATTIADWVQSTFDLLLKTVIPGINSGSISTKAQIDSAIIVS